MYISKKCVNVVITLYLLIGRVSCTGNRHPIPGDRAPAAIYQ